MRPTIRLLSETFGVKYLFVVPASVFLIAYIVKGGDIDLLKVVNPTNVGALTLLLMFAFGSLKGLFTLVRLLPAKPGKVAASLQLTLYLVLVTINAPYLLLPLIFERISPSGIDLQYNAIFLLINLIFMVTLFNLLLPLLLLNRLKPLKIAIMSISVGTPLLIGEVSSLMAKKLGDLTLTAVLIFGIIAMLTCLMSYRLSKARISAYEA
jgi:hypothetical protein